MLHRVLCVCVCVCVYVCVCVCVCVRVCVCEQTLVKQLLIKSFYQQQFIYLPLEVS